MNVEAGTVVHLHLTVTDDGGQVLEHTGHDGIQILIGAGYVVGGLETALIGLTAGSPFDLTLGPEAAYGPKTTAGPQVVPRRELPRDIATGMPVRLRASDGSSVTLWVHRVEGSRAWIDRDHPHAGKTVRFHGHVAGVRGATADEISHGHVHGPGSDHHH